MTGTGTQTQTLTTGVTTIALLVLCIGKLKTVGGVEGTRYLLPVDFCNIRTQKMSKFKTCKK